MELAIIIIHTIKSATFLYYIFPKTIDKVHFACSFYGQLCYFQIDW